MSYDENRISDLIDGGLHEQEQLFLSHVSQRSELLKAEDSERSFDEYLEKYFKEPKVELIYRSLHDGKEMTEKEIIRMYKQAYRL